MDFIYLVMIVWAAAMAIGIIIALLPVILFIAGAVIMVIVISAIANAIGFAFH